jgi:hypothetical protein
MRFVPVLSACSWLSERIMSDKFKSLDANEKAALESTLYRCRASMGRVYTVKPGNASTGTRSRDEDSKSSKASTRTSSKDDDGKPSKASTKTSSKDDDGKSSGSRKGATSAAKAEANANSGHSGRQTQRRWSVEHEAAASKGSGRASSVQRAGSSAGDNPGTQGASLTGTNSNVGDFDESPGEARIDDLVEQPPK